MFKWWNRNLRVKLISCYNYKSLYCSRMIKKLDRSHWIMYDTIIVIDFFPAN